ncbi:MAG: inositol monophosphatase [Chloroflexi bacterium]|nr:inositol monophosphatase [Chloroflexota bacterium]
MNSIDEFTITALLARVKQLQGSVRDEIRNQLRASSSIGLAQPAGIGAGDISYQIDLPAETMIGDALRSWSQDLGGVVVISEGTGVQTYPSGMKAEDAALRMLVDPLDGTREIMYNKRSAWILTGVAPNKGRDTTLSDIEVAVQTEVPILKQNIGSVLWAIKGQGAFEEQWNLDEDRLVESAKPLHPTNSESVRHGFAIFMNCFPGVRVEISEISENTFHAVLGPAEKGSALVFDDQYLSTAGQLYLLASGKYRFVADLRAFMDSAVQDPEKRSGLCCHPYDLSASLIATEAGVIVTGSDDREIIYPLDTETDCSWIGYGNQAIKDEMSAALLLQLDRAQSQ